MLKINLYVYFFQDWMYIEEILIKLNILEKHNKIREKVKIVLRGNLIVNRYTIKISKS